MLLLWVQLPRNLLLKLPDSTDTATNTGVPMMAVTSPVKSTPSSHPVNTWMHLARVTTLHSARCRCRQPAQLGNCLGKMPSNWNRSTVGIHSDCQCRNLDAPMHTGCRAPHPVKLLCCPSQQACNGQMRHAPSQPRLSRGVHHTGEAKRITLATEKSSSTPGPLCSMMLVGVTSRYAPMTLAQAWMAAAMSCITSHSQQLWGIALLPNRRPKGWNTSA